jgi:hypothetical protein
MRQPAVTPRAPGAQHAFRSDPCCIRPRARRPTLAMSARRRAAVGAIVHEDLQLLAFDARVMVAAEAEPFASRGPAWPREDMDQLACCGVINAVQDWLELLELAGYGRLVPAFRARGWSTLSFFFIVMAIENDGYDETDAHEGMPAAELHALCGALGRASSRGAGCAGRLGWASRRWDRSRLR